MLRSMMPGNEAGRPWKAVAAGLSALLLVVSFPPFDSAAAAWVALVPLLLVSMASAPREAFRWGLMAGGGFWLGTLSWLLALSRTGGPWPLVALGWILLSAYCALYTGLFAMAASQAWATLGRPGADGRPDRLVARVAFMGLAPCLWVGLEYGRSILFSGFPWNALGVSQYRNLAMIQAAEWGGVYAISWLIVAMNTALALTARRFVVRAGTAAGRSQFRPDLALAMGLCLLAWWSGIRSARQVRLRESGFPVVRVAAVQPAVPQLRKWSDGFIAGILSTLERQTELAAAARPDLIVWPETALPSAVNSDPDSAALVERLSRAGSPILVGTLEEEWATDVMRLYNSSVLYENGEPQACYRKQHLVPFGEYLPLDQQIPWLQRWSPLGFSCSAGRESTVMRLAARPVAFSALICFEDAFPGLARRAVRRGARLLINQTNDAWFDGTAGARQHLAHSVFRCVENRVSMVRAANTGVTAFIDAAGGIDAMDEAGPGAAVGFKVSNVAVPPPDAPLTLYTRRGDWMLGVPCGAGAACFLLVMWIQGARMRRSVNGGAEC